MAALQGAILVLGIAVFFFEYPVITALRGQKQSLPFLIVPVLLLVVALAIAGVAFTGMNVNSRAVVAVILLTVLLIVIWVLSAIKRKDHAHRLGLDGPKNKRERIVVVAMQVIFWSLIAAAIFA